MSSGLYIKKSSNSPQILVFRKVPYLPLLKLETCANRSVQSRGSAYKMSVGSKTVPRWILASHSLLYM